MFGMTGIQELIILMLVIGVLSLTGIWPTIVQGLRELRGGSTPTPDGMSQSESELCFKVLGISPSASWPEIERAYREKAKIHHPDRGGDEDAMRALNEIYNVLKRKRRP